MKSFSQFLKEEEARQGSLMTRSGKPQDFRNPKKTPFTATDPTPTPASKRLPAGAPEAPKTSPGQLEIPEPKSTRVSRSQFRNAGEARQGSLFAKSGKPQNFTGGRTPFVGTEPVKATKRLPAAAPEAPKASPGQQVIRQTSNPPTTKALPPGPKGGTLATRGTNLQAPPESMMKGAYDAARKQASTPKPSSGGKPPGLPPSGAKPTASVAKSTVGKPPAGVKPSGVKGLRGVGGKALGVAGAALEGGIEYKSQRDRGRTRAGALGGASSAVGGGLAGAKGGALTGAKLGSVLGPKGAAAGALIGGIGGYVAGSELGKKGFETVAGATKKEKTAMATANRQRQAGTAVKGIGGKTTFSQTKPGGPAFMSTGSGSQRKTVQLAKTGVVQRGGQSVAGYLAKKDGKAVYKAGPDPSTLARTSTNWRERIGRSVAPGAYKAHDAKQAAKKLATARASDAARNKALGVKAKPAG